MTYIKNTEITSRKNATNGYAGLDGTTKVPTAELGDASANSTTFLRGDRSWEVPGANVVHTVISSDSSYNVLATDYLIRVGSDTTNQDIILPDASGNVGKVFIIKNHSAISDKVITISASFTDTIDGDSSQNISVPFDAFTLISGSSSVGIWDIV